MQNSKTTRGGTFGRSASDNLQLAVFAIVLAVFALSLGDALIKRISVDFTLWQIFVVRSMIAAPVLVLFIGYHAGWDQLVPRTLGWTTFRSLLLTLMWLTYYAALPHLTLSVAAAAYYTLPIFITLLAAVFLGEAIGTRGWIAVLVGFAGVLVMLRPQADDFNAYALLPLVSAGLYALAMIITRSKCRHEAPLRLSLALNLSFIVVGGLATIVIGLWRPSGPAVAAYPQLLGLWTPMGPDEWLAMGLLAAALFIGSIFAAIAYQSGRSSVVATFDFAYLPFAVVWGILFFAEMPDAVTVTGMVLIVAAGVLSVWR